MIKQGTLREMHPYMMNKYVQQAAKQTKGIQQHLRIILAHLIICNHTQTYQGITQH